MNEVRKQRQAKNEVLFRSVNERVQAIAQELAFEGLVAGEDQEEYLCECADETCLLRVPLSRPEYEHVRASAIQFVVTPGHVVGDIETVIEANERFAVVQKDVGERALAEATNPRA